MDAKSAQNLETFFKSMQNTSVVKQIWVFLTFSGRKYNWYW